MKHKKLLISAYIVILTIIVALMLNKIFAAGNTAGGKNVKYAEYTVESTDKAVITTRVHSKDASESIGEIYHDDLDKNWWIFCTQGETAPLPYKDGRDYIWKIDSGKWSYDGGDFDAAREEAVAPGADFQVRNVVSTTTQVKVGTTYYSRRLDPDTLNAGNVKDNINVSKAEAYLLSTVREEEGSEGSYSAYQKALWQIKNVVGGEENIVYKRAKAFEDYCGEREHREEEIKVQENNSTNGKYTFKYDGNGYFIAGPIKIDYGYLIKEYNGTSLTVRTIDNMKLIATKLDGSSEEIDDGNFTLVKANGAKWEIEDAGDPAISDKITTPNKYNFPKSGESFYIKISSDIYSQYSSIDSFNVTFKMLNAKAQVSEVSNINIQYSEWITDCYATDVSGDGYQHVGDSFYCDICGTTHGCYYHTYNGDYHDGCESYCSEDHWDIPVYDDDGNIIDWNWSGHGNYCITDVHHSYYDLNKLRCSHVQDGPVSAQNLWILTYGELYWEPYNLTIEFEPPKNTPTPSTGTPTPPNQTYIDIGGNVWVDMPAPSKTGGDNATSGDTYDFARPNVKVQLFFSDGTPVKAGQRKVIDKDNIFNGGEYITYTDKNGNYKFYYLPVENNYFVRFTYDGVTYESVEPLAGGSLDEYKKIDSKNKVYPANSSKYDNNSKATEEIEQIYKINRTEFNNKFEEISGNTKINKNTERTYGKSSEIDSLEYWSTEFDKLPESRLLTTDKKNDVITLRKTGYADGIAKQDYEISADTLTTYPFRDNGMVIIRDQDDKYQLAYLDHVNLGLKLRRTADLALRVQVKAGATTIKDKEKVVGYGLRSDKIVDGTQLEEEWVKQEISVSDYFWKDKYTAIYGEEGSAIQGMLLDEFADQLNVYVLYKIDIDNQCEDSDEYGRITELVDYFDTRLCLITDPTELSKVRKLFGSLTTVGGNDNQFSWIVSSGTGVTWHSEPKENGNNKTYNEIKTDGLDLTVKETESIYLILKVANREDNANLLYTGTDSDTDGLENITEISKYTIYNGSNIAGKVDKDSAPENAIPGDKETYEDDTDAAPMFRLEINWVPKEIKGNVWDDLNEDGINNSENPVKDVTVKLVEYIETADGIIEVERPGLYIDEGKSEIGTREAPIKTDENGNYSFYVEGGNYRLKFIYGDTEMLLSNKKYNGQDYQATAYTPIHSYNELACETEEGLAGITDRLSMDDRDYSYKKAQEDYENENWLKSRDESAARDDANIRSDTIKNASIITYENGSLLRNLSADKTVDEAIATTLSGGNKVEHKSVYQNSDENPNYTYMEALTDIFAISSNDLADYQIVNFGLKERPTADMSLDKTVERIVLKTSDGTTLIDTADASKLKNMQKLGELGNELDSTFINMDAVAMDGATLDIDYKIAINYNGEEDKLQNYVYVESDEAIINELVNELRTKLNMPELTRTDNILTRSDVFDYVSINLEFRKDDNSTQDWTKVYDEDDKNVTTVKDEVTANGVEGITIYNSSDTNEYIKYNTITKNIVDEVLPRNAKIVSKVLRTESENLNSDTREDPIPLHLGITLSENTTKNDVNDFDFSNSAEIVTIYTSAGRRQYVDNDATTEEEKLGTIPGNYTPYDRTEENNVEHDGDTTGITSVTPPLGDQKIYYVIAIVSATIIIVGIVLIKKKVLKK